MRGQTEEFETHLGSIKAETTECVNCGAKVLTKDAVSVGVGLRTKNCHGAMICDAKHDTFTGTRDLCSYCAEHTLDVTRGHQYASKVSNLSACAIGGVLGAVLTAVGFVSPKGLLLLLLGILVLVWGAMVASEL